MLFDKDKIKENLMCLFKYKITKKGYNKYIEDLNIVYEKLKLNNMEATLSMICSCIEDKWNRIDDSDKLILLNIK